MPDDPPHPPAPDVQSEHSKINSARIDALEAGERIGAAVLSKTATWAVSLGVLILSVATSFGLIIYFVGDKLLAFQAASADIRHLQVEHDHCIMEVTNLKARVLAIENKNTASNQ